VLDGCLRRSILDSGECEEGVLYPNDLARADVVYLGNSLRGLIRAVPITDKVLPL
jgi:branched-subunit amino acid aminotransferase/4-amino-4-deoxychorismate lyase